MPETLYRLCALCALRATGANISAALAAAQQLSVGVSSAAEGIAAAVRLYLEQPLDALQDPDSIVEAAEPIVRFIINADSSNAFNCVDRGAMLQGVAEVAPQLLPFVRSMYRRAGRLVLPNTGSGAERYRLFMSQTGARQGDPLGPVLYALAVLVAMKRVQAAHPGLLIPQFVDDVEVCVEGVGEAAASAQGGAVFQTLRTEMRAIGVDFDTDSPSAKTHAYCAQAGVVLNVPGIRQRTDGTVVLGAPMGVVDFVRARVRKRLAQSFEQLALLPELDFGDALQILRRSIVPRARFLASSLSREALHPIFVEWDAAVRTCLGRMFRTQPHPRCFPSGPACLGIAEMCAEMSLDRVNGWERAKEVIQAHLPTVAPLTTITEDSAHPVHREVLEAWARLPESVRSADGVQAPTAALDAVTTPASPLSIAKKAADARRKLADAYSTHLRTTVLDSLDRTGKLLMLAASTRGAREWLDAAPAPHYYRMSSDEGRIATCLWLGAPICELRGSADQLGRSILRMRGLPRMDRHRGVNSVLGDLHIEAGDRVWQEPSNLYPALAEGSDRGAQRRPDLAVVTPAMARVLLDGTVRDTATATLVGRTDALERPLRSVTLAEEEKNAHYLADTPEGFTFQPIALGSVTEPGPSTRAYLGALAVRLAYRHNNGQPPARRLVDAKKRLIRARLGCAVMRGQAAQIIAAQIGSPHAALLTARRYVHSAQRAAAHAQCMCEAAASGSGAECVCYSNTPLARGAPARGRSAAAA
jgi:hypothetical protein